MWRFNNSARPDRIAAFYDALSPTVREEFSDLFVAFAQPTYEDYAARYRLDGDKLVNTVTGYTTELRGATTSCASFLWNGRKKYIKLPRLVAILKYGRLLREDEQADHINHDPNDHRPSNIRILTRSDNAKYRRGASLPPGISVRKSSKGLVFYAGVTTQDKFVKTKTTVLAAPFTQQQVIAAIRETATIVEDLHLRCGYGTNSVYLTRSFNWAAWQLDEKVFNKWTAWFSSTPKQPGS